MRADEKDTHINMSASEKGARLVGRRFRRASWVFGLFSLIVFTYIGQYSEAVLSGLAFWGVFQLAARAVERAGA